MNTSLRLAVVTLLVGGGFTLLVGNIINLRGLAEDKSQSAFIFWAMILCSLFIVAAGLLLVHNPRRRLPAQIALGIQVPWLSSPWLTYKIFTGLSLYTVASSRSIPDVMSLGGHLGFIFRFGSYSSLWIWGENAWAIGVNWVALLLLMLVHLSVGVRNEGTIGEGAELSRTDKAINSST